MQSRFLCRNLSLSIIAVACFAVPALSGAEQWLEIQGVQGVGPGGTIPTVGITFQALSTPSVRSPQHEIRSSGMQVSKLIDKSSPVLFLACATGRRFPSATLTLTEGAPGANPTYTQYELTNVLISSYSAKTVSRGELPEESIILSFATINMTHSPSDPRELVSTGRIRAKIEIGNLKSGSAD